MKDLTIGQVAKRASVRIETIRYYERFGLIPEPSRRPYSGYREYNENAVLRLNFIKSAKELGFSLKEISELFALRVRSRTTCGDVKRRTEIKIADIEEKIKTLQRIKKALKRLSDQCKEKGPVGECPIIENFNSIKT